MPSKNPFLSESFLPAWSKLTPSELSSAIDQAIAMAEKDLAAIEALSSEQVTFENTYGAYERTARELSFAWGLASHLDSVCNSEALRLAYNECLPRVTDFYSSICLRKKLWEVLQSFQADDASLSSVQQRFIQETNHEFVQAGANLSDEDKKTFSQITSRLASVTQKFSENVLDTTNDWEYLVTDESMLDGLPGFAKEAARESAKGKGHGDEENPVWRFTLQMPSYVPVMTYAKSEDLRKVLYEGSCLIGNKGDKRNEELILEILQLRQQKAKLLGYDHFCDLVLEKRMAKDASTVVGFIETMHDKIADKFQVEITALEAFRAEKEGTPPDHFQPWQTSYWSEQLRKEQYAFDEEELRPYFAVQSVMAGMFSITEELFGIKIVERPTYCGEESPSSDHIEVWHEDVTFYEIYDQKNEQHLGSFYADWFPRESKRGGAWMNNLRTAEYEGDQMIKPHLGLICGNMTKPVGQKPALLSHNEVTTVFHEFGHLLHHLLGNVPIAALNGVHVAWDFVELPSQLLENWCWERESLDKFAQHYETKEPIPQDLFDKMMAAKNFQSALFTMRQLSLGKTDMALHLQLPKVETQGVQNFLDDELASYRMPLKTKSPTIANRFTHIFGDPVGYASGYYSYKWAEVLEADVFSVFKKGGVLSPALGKKLREEILSRGNSEPPEVLFKNFMGRDPDSDALLERSGLLN